MLAVSSLQQPDTQNALAEKMQLPNGADVPETIAQLPDEARRQIMEQMTEKLDGMPESIVTQGAIRYLKMSIRKWAKIWTRFRCSMCCGPELRCCFWQH